MLEKAPEEYLILMAGNLQCIDRIQQVFTGNSCQNCAIIDYRFTVLADKGVTVKALSPGETAPGFPKLEKRYEPAWIYYFIGDTKDYRFLQHFADNLKETAQFSQLKACYVYCSPAVVKEENLRHAIEQEIAKLLPNCKFYHQWNNADITVAIIANVICC